MNFEELREKIQKMEYPVRGSDLVDLLKKEKIEYDHVEAETLLSNGIYIVTLDYGHMVIPYYHDAYNDEFYNVIERNGIKRLGETDLLKNSEIRLQKQLETIEKYKTTQQLRNTVKG